MEQVPIVILDFGSQYTQLIARRLREAGVYCEIYPYFEEIERIEAKRPQGIIFSGGPASVYDPDAPRVDRRIYDLGLPILGICYGMQLITTDFGGEVIRALEHEYGKARLHIDRPSKLFKGTKEGQIVWMSHGDKVEQLPKGFLQLAHTDNSPYAAIAHGEREIYALQFHPEVSHSEEGEKILRNFAREVCGITSQWDMGHFAKEQIEKIRREVGRDKVLCALSGGVDSSVVTALLYEAIGDQLIPVFVDNGLLRAGEREKVEHVFKNILQVPLIVIDGRERFLQALKGVTDPEEKRKIIGHTFIELFEEEAKRHKGVKYLAQGTLYPDVIESVSVKGPSETIKSHHNVGGLPEWMEFKLIEPLRELFKDEVRKLGLELGLPREMVYRHPFPGPGLAIRILGEVTPEALDLVRRADTILLEEIKAHGLYEKLWQSFAVLLNVKSVGVMGDKRTYENTVALRIVESSDGMTATFAHIPHDLLELISNRIINEVDGINRVVFDITSKPPGTIEWE
ncbi:MAG: glutamine-hydrolyzing GMP synthase [Epsilonproteobacteria bacterium]|nr:GMP synthase (glutamine-hydrolyzing) [Campylobacterota bacterium]NPA56491.1 glutamine-hydrolyzing GMP synthase [Campylobacterota bacterium]